MKKDWHLFRTQEAYLYKLFLIYRSYEPANPNNDYDLLKIIWQKIVKYGFVNNAMMTLKKDLNR